MWIRCDPRTVPSGTSSPVRWISFPSNARAVACSFFFHRLCVDSGCECVALEAYDPPIKTLVQTQTLDTDEVLVSSRVPVPS